jgi:hypothetical protein
LYQLYKYFDYQAEPEEHSVMRDLRIVKALAKAGKIGWAARWKWWRYNKAQRKGIYRAITTFNEAAAKGEAHLDTLYGQFCGKPPVPKKN